MKHYLNLLKTTIGHSIQKFWCDWDLHGLICQNNGKEAFETILNMLSEFAGRILNVDDKVFSYHSGLIELSCFF